jgi:hypothetical protein
MKKPYTGMAAWAVPMDAAASTREAAIFIGLHESSRTVPARAR